MTIPDTFTIIFISIIALAFLFIAGYVWTAGKHKAIKDLYNDNTNDTDKE